jgi:5-methylcytosine-specific restriction endonuclease McrA
MAKKGNIPWNKGLLKLENRNCKTCNKIFTVKVSPSRAGRGKFCNTSCRSKFFKGELASHWKGGLPKCLICKKQLTNMNNKYCKSHAHAEDRNPNWNGGTTPERIKEWRSEKYKLWRKSIFERDNYTCVSCKDNTGGNLEADHIKPWILFLELRYELSNGQTLCEECHDIKTLQDKIKYNFYRNKMNYV